MRRYVLLTLALVMAALAGGGLGLIALPNARAAEATFALQSGEATLFSAGGARRAIAPGSAASSAVLIGMGDQLTVNGSGSLTLGMAQIALGRETRLTLRRHNWLPLSGWDVEILLERGQISGRVMLPPDARFALTSPAGQATLAAGQAEFYAYATADGHFQVGMGSGTAIARSARDPSVSVQIRAGQGTTLRPDQPAADAIAWSPVRAALYQANGSAADAPLALVNMASGERYWLQPGQLMLIPGGTYELHVDLLVPYRAANLALSTSRVNNLPVTLSEVVFLLVDPMGAPIDDMELLVRSSETARSARAGQPVLISPGQWKLQVSRAAAPDLLYLAEVNASPGQRKSVRMRTDLFGGGTPQVQVFAPDGQPARPLDVNVFTSGGEGREPLVRFRTSDAPPLLPEGSYVISVLTSVAARFEVRIQGGKQNQPIIVRQGTLQVDYRRANGQAVTRDVYIANADIMERFGVEDPRDLRSKPGGAVYVIALKTGQTVTLPVGEYNVLVDDTRDARADRVSIAAGEGAKLELQAAR